MTRSQQFSYKDKELFVLCAAPPGARRVAPARRKRERCVEVIQTATENQLQMTTVLYTAIIERLANIPTVLYQRSY